MFGYKLWCANVPLSYLSAFTLHKRSTHNANAKVTALHNMALNQGQVLILFINYHNYLDDYDMLLLAENFFNTFTFTEQGSPKNRPLKGNLQMGSKTKEGGVVETEKRKSKVTLDMLFAVLRKNYYKLLDITD